MVSDTRPGLLSGRTWGDRYVEGGCICRTVSSVLSTTMRGGKSDVVVVGRAVVAVRWGFGCFALLAWLLPNTAPAFLFGRRLNLRPLPAQIIN